MRSFRYVLADVFTDRALAGNHAELRSQSACQLGRLHHYAGRLRQATELLDTAIAGIQ